MTSPTFDALQLSVEGRVGRLTLGRPTQSNALNYQDLADLIEAADWLNEQVDVAVVIIAGEGPSFCGGFNLTNSGEPPGDGDADLALDFGRRAMNAVSALRAIVVARVQGRARGGGLVLALACDLSVVADDARLSLPEAHLGMPVPWATLPRLVRLLGPMRAKELALAGYELDGPTAVGMGLATRSAPAPLLDQAVDDLVAHLLAAPNRVIREVKQEIERLAESIASTANGAGDVQRLKDAFVDPECNEARRTYLARRPSSAPTDGSVRHM